MLLQPAKMEYLTILLCAAYDFRGLISRFSSFSRAVKTMDSIQGDAPSFFIPVIGGLEGLQIIAERFQQQIRQIIYTPVSLPSRPIASPPNLVERLKAAANYFSPKLKQIIDAIAKCSLRTNDKSDAAFLKQNLSDLHADIARIVHIHSALITDPTIDGYFQARKSFRWVDPKFVVQATRRKVRSDASAFQSLTLFYRGMTIPQIAKERKMTQRTIAKHLRFFIDQDMVNISNFQPSDQILLAK